MYRLHLNMHAPVVIFQTANIVFQTKHKFAGCILSTHLLQSVNNIALDK